ncbi:MAG: penicillin acylase family protein [Streptosporangiales bacterium]|nr:penicillin acylase family protein [Streptosporangiales bacterium]
MAESYEVPGLTGPAEILVDRWGVPHVYASSRYDAFLVQGFNAARDRLWQLDFWRRRGLGLLADAFGAAYVEHDRAARLFLYRGDMHGEWLAYGSDTKRVCTAFVAGVNAYVRLTRDDPALLPPEFRDLAYEPALWSPEDVARIRSHGLFRNLRHEVARALVLRDFGPEVEELCRHWEPAGDLVVPEGLDLDAIPGDVLRVYDLATLPPMFPAESPEGSNSWVLSAARTATGRPMLANDPHRAVSLPSLRYLAHLSAPGLDVIGGGEPALPGISIGHNGHAAFGVTIHPIDQEDLYVYETCPDDSRAYRYDGRWEPMRVVRESVPIRDAAPVDVELVFTRHGPVIHADADRGTAFAVRAAWLEQGMAPYLGSMDSLSATSWDGFVAAMNRWGAPPENQIYADTGGAIGWKAAGLTPIRPNWDGALPVPGDGRYEWAGFYDMDQLPEESDPARGWIATANDENLPPDFPPERTITVDWYPPFRHRRIDEVLATATGVTVDDMVRLQTDYVSLPARRIVERLRGVPVDDPSAARARALLLDWDADLRPDSAAAALFEVWYRRHLRPALLRRALEPLVPADRLDDALRRCIPGDDSQHADARVDLDLVERPAFEDVAGPTLRDAVTDVEALLGTDPAGWAWGRLHVAAPAHPLAALLRTVPRDKAVLPPLARGGSADTVGHTAYDTTFTQTAGATFRMVIDVGEWDRSVVMNAPGQSGRPDSAHYDDLADAWAHDGAFPLLYTRAAVEAEVEHRITLTPVKSY